jgi:hypothetical protein
MRFLPFPLKQQWGLFLETCEATVITLRHMLFVIEQFKFKQVTQKF